MEIECYKLLKQYKNRLTIQQYKTLKGQINSGDYDGFVKGLFKIAKRKVLKNEN
jgi:hypothetical protein